MTALKEFKRNNSYYRHPLRDLLVLVCGGPRWLKYTHLWNETSCPAFIASSSKCFRLQTQHMLGIVFFPDLQFIMYQSLWSAVIIQCTVRKKIQHRYKKWRHNQLWKMTSLSTYEWSASYISPRLPCRVVYETYFWIGYWLIWISGSTWIQIFKWAKSTPKYWNLWLVKYIVNQCPY